MRLISAAIVLALSAVCITQYAENTRISADNLRYQSELERLADELMAAEMEAADLRAAALESALESLEGLEDGPVAPVLLRALQ